MNARRLELGITWADVAKTAGVSYEALRKLRSGPFGPRELTDAKISRALGWKPGSIAAILGGGTPAMAAADTGAEPAAVTVLRQALSAPERVIMDSDLSDQDKAELVAEYRAAGGDTIVREFADKLRARACR